MLGAFLLTAFLQMCLGITGAPLIPQGFWRPAQDTIPPSVPCPIQGKAGICGCFDLPQEFHTVPGKGLY